jgi:hypothetical protein
MDEASIRKFTELINDQGKNCMITVVAGGGGMTDSMRHEAYLLLMDVREVLLNSGQKMDNLKIWLNNEEKSNQIHGMTQNQGGEKFIIRVSIDEVCSG